MSYTAKMQIWNTKYVYEATESLSGINAMTKERTEIIKRTKT